MTHGARGPTSFVGGNLFDTLQGHLEEYRATEAAADSSGSRPSAHRRHGRVSHEQDRLDTFLAVPGRGLRGTLDGSGPVFGASAQSDLRHSRHPQCRIHRRAVFDTAGISLPLLTAEQDLKASVLLDVEHRIVQNALVTQTQMVLQPKA